MAKTPPQPPIDRFRIICEAEAADMGPIIAQLSRMGLTNIGFELMTDVVQVTRRGEEQSFPLAKAVQGGQRIE